MKKQVVIVGGVAGGMSCAARLRRLDEEMAITVFEKGPDVSFANCGMPYFIGGEIASRASMNVQTAEGIRARYAIDARTRHEVLRIDRANKTVEVKNLETGETFSQPYDALVLSPGSEPIRPPIPGADSERAFVLNNLVDMDAIASSAARHRSVCIVGGGFIGLELAENLRRRGLQVWVVEMLDHVMPPLDAEMAAPLLGELIRNGVGVRLNATAEAIEEGKVRLKGGEVIPSAFVCLCAGVRPRTKLAAEAGLTLGERGHIRVDDHLRTNDPNIYAVGDAVETRNLVTGEWGPMPLAGPANRQGRIAADNIAGRDSVYAGSQGTAILRLFDLAAAHVGLNERQLQTLDMPYLKVYLHPNQHPGYFPGATPVSTKLLFSPEGMILGAQVVGAEGVEPMINALAQAQRAGMGVEDLEELELAYSPQWGGAKHGVNMLGFVAGNVLRGDVVTMEADGEEDVVYLDVRNPPELEAGVLPNSVNIPLDQLRERFSELPRDKVLVAYCAIGLRGYVASRYLEQQGFQVRNLNGGYRSWMQHQMKVRESNDAAPPLDLPPAGA
jgi:NADPH-dependent 2,4-dienoyl-CoA reductase/sulfur reductase-like enzyme/rhodanese-related sulfurtransferase